MKDLLILLFLTVGFSFNSFSQTATTDADFKNMAKDMCDCVNKHAKGLSSGMRDAIIESSKDGADMEAIVQAQVMKDEEQGMKDIEAITAVAEGVEQCGVDIEAKYRDIYSDNTQDEVEAKLIEVLAKEKGCEFTYALMKIGLKEEASEGYYDEEYYYDEEE